MNQLEQTTHELPKAGYTLEEIKSAVEEVIEQAKESEAEHETDN